jgi:hypothetical protein
MATLKGQNIRLLQFNGSGKYEVFAKSTSCIVTLTGNAEDASHKDIVGNAAMPTIVSKNWQMQLESLEVLDIYRILFAMLNGTQIEVYYDEVSTANNQTPTGNALARAGAAYISDATFNFNDRENAVKSITLSGTGAPRKETAPQIVEVDPSMAFTKGQFVRLYLGNDNTATPSAVLAFAKQLAFHVSVSLENNTTKDTEGDWINQEPVGLSHDISTNALVDSGESITSQVNGQRFSTVEEIYEASAPVKFEIANVSGTNNRTKGNVLISGSVVVTSLVLNAPNRQTATYDTQMQGYGNYTVNDN